MFKPVPSQRPFDLGRSKRLCTQGISFDTARQTSHVTSELQQSNPVHGQIWSLWKKLAKKTFLKI